MAKLYAEITSDKGGRVVGKGGNKHVVITTKHANEIDYRVVVKPHSLLVTDRDDNILFELLGYYRG